MTATTTVPTVPIGRFTLAELSGLLAGIAATTDRPDVRAQAELLAGYANAIVEEVLNVVRLADERRGQRHLTKPTFKMLGAGDGQPTGFECDGCGERWTVAPGEDAADLIPTLRRHASDDLG